MTTAATSPPVKTGPIPAVGTWLESRVGRELHIVTSTAKWPALLTVAISTRPGDAEYFYESAIRTGFPEEWTIVPTPVGRAFGAVTAIVTGEQADVEVVHAIWSKLPDSLTLRFSKWMASLSGSKQSAFHTIDARGVSPWESAGNS